jgi:hypothetical protein
MDLEPLWVGKTRDLWQRIVSDHRKKFWWQQTAFVWWLAYNQGRKSLRQVERKHLPLACRARRVAKRIAFVGRSVSASSCNGGAEQ